MANWVDRLYNDTKNYILFKDGHYEEVTVLKFNKKGGELKTEDGRVIRFERRPVHGPTTLIVTIGRRRMAISVSITEIVTPQKKKERGPKGKPTPKAPQNQKKEVNVVVIILKKILQKKIREAGKLRKQRFQISLGDKVAPQILRAMASLNKRLYIDQSGRLWIKMDKTTLVKFILDPLFVDFSEGGFDEVRLDKKATSKRGGAAVADENDYEKLQSASLDVDVDPETSETSEDLGIDFKGEEVNTQDIRIRIVSKRREGRYTVLVTPLGDMQPLPKEMQEMIWAEVADYYLSGAIPHLAGFQTRNKVFFKGFFWPLKKTEFELVGEGDRPPLVDVDLDGWDPMPGVYVLGLTPAGSLSVFPMKISLTLKGRQREIKLYSEAQEDYIVPLIDEGPDSYNIGDLAFKFKLNVMGMLGAHNGERKLGIDNRRYNRNIQYPVVRRTDKVVLIAPPAHNVPVNSLRWEVYFPDDERVLKYGRYIWDNDRPGTCFEEDGKVFRYKGIPSYIPNILVVDLGDGLYEVDYYDTVDYQDQTVLFTNREQEHCQYLRRGMAMLLNAKEQGGSDEVRRVALEDEFATLALMKKYITKFGKEEGLRRFYRFLFPQQEKPVVAKQQVKSLDPKTQERIKWLRRLHDHLSFRLWIKKAQMVLEPHERMLEKLLQKQQAQLQVQQPAQPHGTIFEEYNLKLSYYNGWLIAGHFAYRVTSEKELKRLSDRFAIGQPSDKAIALLEGLVNSKSLVQPIHMGFKKITGLTVYVLSSTDGTEVTVNTTYYEFLHAKFAYSVTAYITIHPVPAVVFVQGQDVKAILLGMVDPSSPTAPKKNGEDGTSNPVPVKKNSSKYSYKQVQDIFNYLASIGGTHIVCVTTNGYIKKDGRGVMGAGIAKRAASIWPDLPSLLGEHLRKNGNHTGVLAEKEYRNAKFVVIAVPVKHNWDQQADLGLIERSIQELVKLTDEKGWSKVWLPAPGCGNGKLTWEQVEPILDKYLDQRFIVFGQGPSNPSPDNNQNNNKQGKGLDVFDVSQEKCSKNDASSEMVRIGITERGDAGLDLSWENKLGKEVGYAILITKNPTDKFIQAVLRHKDKVIVHLTCTGLGGTIIEPNVPGWRFVFEQYQKLLAQGFDPNRIVLRVDPIFPIEEHLRTVRRILDYNLALPVPIRRVRFSIVDLYDHVKERLDRAGIELPWDTFKAPKERIQMIIDFLKQYDDRLVIEACAEDVPEKWQIGCVSARDFEIFGLDPALATGKSQQRPACKCIAGKTELLNNKCRCWHGCLYCYWKDPVLTKKN